MMVIGFTPRGGTTLATDTAHQVGKQPPDVIRPSRHKERHEHSCRHARTGKPGRER
jgi:hypothetical protein